MSADHPDLPLEQQRNADYMAWFKGWLEGRVTYGRSRNEIWVNPNTNVSGKSYDLLHPLIGRVALTEPDETLGTDFYIGPRWGGLGSTTVSWLAPIARAFYRPDDPGHGLHGRIAAVRTFTNRVHEVVAVDEERYVDTEGPPFATTELTVEAPEKRGPRRRLATAGPRSNAPMTDTGKPDEAASDSGASSERQHLVGMRAAGAVLSRVRAPRDAQLQSVLATLQPDQHELVTRSATADLIVQGHPGTGKTVVAAYRAGFLITPDRPDEQSHGGGQERVLLVGPTPGYVSHVGGLVRPFQDEAAGSLQVTDLRTFMAKIVGFKSPWSGGIDGERDDVDDKALALVQRAAEIVRTSVGYDREVVREVTKRNVARTYNTLRANGRPGLALTTDPGVQAWLGKLPAFEEASQLRRYLPLIAQCRMAQKPFPPSTHFHHIIVDEAQDVSPLEWSLLQQYLHPYKGRWTLVGDQNQRRSFTSHTSWAGIVDQLKLGASDDAVLHQAVMERGYRSTNEILTFADGLLTPSLRLAGSIQDAGAPVARVLERKSKRLYATALETAVGLARKHDGGTVALITVYPERLVADMATIGWRRPSEGDHRTWSLDDVTVRVFSPAQARGLEFDAVVVIEPSQYDNDNGRHGQLYTSLTRANRELAVVYHRQLPAGLRERR